MLLWIAAISGLLTAAGIVAVHATVAKRASRQLRAAVIGAGLYAALAPIAVLFVTWHAYVIDLSAEDPVMLEHEIDMAGWAFVIVTAHYAAFGFPVGAAFLGLLIWIAMRSAASAVGRRVPA